MEKKLVIVTKGATFMVDAISKNLKEAGFDVYVCAPDIKEAKNLPDGIQIVLLYLGDYIDECKEFFVFLKDYCIEDEILINVIGDAGEVESLNQYIPSNLFDKVFPRPLDIKKLTATLMETSEDLDTHNNLKSILLVDDDPTFLKLTKSWLSEKYRVTIVSSGMQAITYIARNTPDLILLDYEMPVTNGPQVLEMIRSESASATIPVIFLTGKSDRESVTSVLELKPDGYILKTVGKVELLRQIADFFERKKGE